MHQLRIVEARNSTPGSRTRTRAGSSSGTANGRPSSTRRRPTRPAATPTPTSTRINSSGGAARNPIGRGLVAQHRIGHAQRHPSHERVPLPGFLSIKWHVVFKMKAHRRPVSAAGGGQLSCNSRTGQIKNPPSECSGSNHIRHSYRMGPEH